LSGEISQFAPAFTSTAYSTQTGLSPFTNDPPAGQIIVNELFIGGLEAPANPLLPFDSGTNFFERQATAFSTVQSGDSAFQTTVAGLGLRGFIDNRIPVTNASYNIVHKDTLDFEFGVNTTNLSAPTVDIQVVSNFDFTISTDNDLSIINAYFFPHMDNSLITEQVDIDIDQQAIGTFGGDTLDGILTTTNALGLTTLEFSGTATNVYMVPVTSGSGVLSGDFIIENGLNFQANGLTSTALLLANFSNSFYFEFTALDPGSSLAVTAIPEPAVSGLFILVGLYTIYRRKNRAGD
jgi:hypothetical protein